MNKLDFTLLLARCGASSQQIRTEQNRLVALRKIRIRRHTRQQVMQLIKAMTAAPRPQTLLPNMIVRARVKHFLPDQSVEVEIGKGGLIAVIPRDQRIPTSRRAGRLKRGDTLWLAVYRIVYHETGVRYEMTMCADCLPLELLKRHNHKACESVELAVLDRIPGVQTVIEVRPEQLHGRADYRLLVAGPNDCHLRAVSQMLRGEAIVLRVNRRAAGQSQSQRDSASGGAYHA